MALVKCPECGKSVSSTINACIHCGYVLNGSRSVKLTENAGNVQRSNTRAEFQDALRKIDRSTFPIIKFALFRPWFLLSLIVLVTLAGCFMAWTWPLLQENCAGLYDIGESTKSLSGVLVGGGSQLHLAHFFGYFCMPDNALTYLRLPIAPLLLGLLCQALGLGAILLALLGASRLRRQYLANQQTALLAKVISLFRARPKAILSFMALGVASISLMSWLWPLVGPRCSVLVRYEPQNGTLSGILDENDYSPSFFGYTCLPIDTSKLDQKVNFIPGSVPGWISIIILTMLLTYSAISLKFLFTPSRSNEKPRGFLKRDKLALVKWSFRPRAVVLGIFTVVVLTLLQTQISNHLHQASNQGSSTGAERSIAGTRTPPERILGPWYAYHHGKGVFLLVSNTYDRYEGLFLSVKAKNFDAPELGTIGVLAKVDLALDSNQSLSATSDSGQVYPVSYDGRNVSLSGALFGMMGVDYVFQPSNAPGLWGYQSHFWPSAPDSAGIDNDPQLLAKGLIDSTYGRLLTLSPLGLSSDGREQLMGTVWDSGMTHSQAFLGEDYGYGILRISWMDASGVPSKEYSWDTYRTNAGGNSGPWLELVMDYKNSEFANSGNSGVFSSNF